MLLWILGAAAIVGGIVLILMAFSYAGWKYGLPGVLCMILGGMLILGSTIGPLKAPWAFGIAAVAGGVAAIVGAFQMKRPRLTAAATRTYAQNPNPRSFRLTQRAMQITR